MTLSTQDYADLSDHAYIPPVPLNSKYPYKPEIINGIEYQPYKPEIINGIKYQPLAYFDGNKKTPPTGYQGTIYQRVDTGEIVVAHRGTEAPWHDGKDAGADATMVFQRVNPQVKDAQALTQSALEYAKTYPGKFHPPPVVTTTGHSLGGSLAQITAHKFHLHAETFNPYGAVSLKYGLHPGQDDIVNHIMAADVVSAASPQPGQVRVYASEKEVHTARALGYTNDNSPSLLQKLADASSPIQAQIGRPLETAVLNLGSHSISNFTNADDQGYPHPSILADPQAQQRATQNATMFDKYRHDVQTIRGTLSLTGDLAQTTSQGIAQGYEYARTATSKGIDAAGQGITQAYDSGSQMLKRGAQALEAEATSSAQALQNTSNRLQKNALHASMGLSRDLDHAVESAGLPPSPGGRANSQQQHRQYHQNTQTVPGHQPGALRQADTLPQDPRHPAHPDHAMYQSVHGQLGALYHAHGIAVAPQQLDNGTAKLMADAQTAHMRSVTHMEFAMHQDGRADPSQAAIFEGDPQNPASKFNVTDMNQALRTPAEQSFQQFTQLTQQQQQFDQQHSTQQPAQGMSIGR